MLTKPQLSNRYALTLKDAEFGDRDITISIKDIQRDSPVQRVTINLSDASFKFIQDVEQPAESLPAELVPNLFSDVIGRMDATLASQILTINLKTKGGRGYYQVEGSVRIFDPETLKRESRLESQGDAAPIFGPQIIGRSVTVYGHGKDLGSATASAATSLFNKRKIPANRVSREEMWIMKAVDAGDIVEIGEDEYQLSSH